MGKVVRVNMSELKVSIEDSPKAYHELGGRGLTSMILAGEVPALCDPLGEKNKLVIAPGFLTGTSAPNSGRLSIGCKSPLTGGIKESNVGGTSPHKIGRLGVNAIVLEGIGKKGAPYVLHLSKDGARLISGKPYEGLKNYELAKKLQSEFGEGVGIISVGPAGEMRLSTASVASTDTSGFPCRHAGRGGTGAVMGAKGLKAIVVDDTDAPGVFIADPAAFREGARKLAKAVQNYPVSKDYKKFGTNVLVNPINTAGAYSARNFRQGMFEEADRVSGETMYEIITKRGGKPSHASCSTCIIQCSNVYVDEKGDFVTASFQYESIWALGANLGISDLDSIAQMDRLCDEYGIDTIETGVAIGVAMEADIKLFGDAKGALELIEEVGKGTPMGRILGSGAWITGKVFGVTRVPTVKKLGIPAYEPRAIQGMGVTYATTPMGAEHTAGWVVDQNLTSMGGKLDPLEAAGQVDASRRSQIIVAAMDCTGLCNFVNRPIRDTPEGKEGFLQILSSLYGTPKTYDDIIALGKKILKAERDFNLAAGMTKTDDRLPEFFKEEKIPPHHVIFKVADDDLDRLFEF